MNNNTNAEQFPWFAHRKNPDAKPVYKIIARSMSLGGDSIAMLHKAGSDYVENYFIRDLVKNESVMNHLDPKEADLLRWVVKSELTNPLEN